MGFDTGILAATETDDELAAFLSFEIARTLARHHNASLSTLRLNTLIQKPIYPFRGIWESLVQLIPILDTHFGGQRVFDMNQEATDIGMLLMAEAGFDPAAMVSFRRKQFKLAERRGPVMIGGPMIFYILVTSAEYDVSVFKDC